MSDEWPGDSCKDIDCEGCLLCGIIDSTGEILPGIREPIAEVQGPEFRFELINGVWRGVSASSKKPLVDKIMEKLGWQRNGSKHS